MALVIGAGISGLSAAVELQDMGWDVTVLEARDRVGGRIWSEHRTTPEGERWVFEHGANWFHGLGRNPVWELARDEHLVSTQWMPRTYRLTLRGADAGWEAGARPGTGAVAEESVDLSPGADDEPVGADLREAYTLYWHAQARFRDYIAAVANGSYAVPDVPVAWLLERFVAERGLRGREVAKFKALVATYGTLDEAADLSQIGMAADLWFGYGDDKEYMSGIEGLGTVTDHLRERLGLAVGGAAPAGRVVTGACVTAITWGAWGVRASTDDGRTWHGAVAVVTLPLGVLQRRSVAFEPPLPSWKERAIDAYRMGALNKVYLRWKTKWWPSGQDAFFSGSTPARPLGGGVGAGVAGSGGAGADSRARASAVGADGGVGVAGPASNSAVGTGDGGPRSDEGPGGSEGVGIPWAGIEWYNLLNLSAGRAEGERPPAVLLATPAGFRARDLEALGDEALVAVLLADLRAAFPNTTVPEPVEVARTRWWSDPLAHGSYSYAPVDADPLVPLRLAEPVSNRLFFAGEATSPLRHGYMDGAYVSGIDAAEAVEEKAGGAGRVPAYQADAGGPLPANDDELRGYWAELMTEVEERRRRALLRSRRSI